MSKIKLFSLSLIFFVIKLLNLFVSIPVVDKNNNNKTKIVKIDMNEKFSIVLIIYS